MTDRRCPSCGATDDEMIAVEDGPDGPHKYLAGAIDVTTLDSARRLLICGRCGATLPSEPFDPVSTE